MCGKQKYLIGLFSSNSRYVIGLESNQSCNTVSMVMVLAHGNNVQLCNTFFFGLQGSDFCKVLELVIELIYAFLELYILFIS